MVVSVKCHAGDCTVAWCLKHLATMLDVMLVVGPGLDDLARERHPVLLATLPVSLEQEGEYTSETDRQ